MTEITFLESIVLLALDDKGWFGSTEHRVKFGLVGAILFELLQMKRIEVVEGGDVNVCDPTPTGIIVCDRVLNHIGESKKRRNIRAWIQRIAFKKLMLRKQILKQLLKKDVVSKEEYTLMIVFYQTKFPLINSEVKRKLQEDLYHRILGELPMDDHHLMLLAIMNTCRMVRKNFGGNLQYLKLRSRINEITQFKTQESPNGLLIKMVQSGISRAIVSSNVSIHA